MVLVSHIHKFIYIKNFKVAGTSVESFFGQFCIDPNDRHSYKFEHSQNETISKWRILGSRGDGSVTIWNNHKCAEHIRSNLGYETFDNYFKFCVVRNPYDIVVSAYHFLKPNHDFKTFCKSLETTNITNVSRILIDGKPSCDYYIRYENLIDDIKTVLHKLNITDFDINDLPKHKTNFNPRNKHYSEYYNKDTVEIVKKVFDTEINMFNYKV